MSDDPDLSVDERAVLRSALDRPISIPDQRITEVCLRLCGRRLMQRAGGVAVVNGWHGSPHAFVLTHEGWSLITAGRRRALVRRTA
jgi:hypothetical protein